MDSQSEHTNEEMRFLAFIHVFIWVFSSLKVKLV